MNELQGNAVPDSLKR